MWRLKQKCGHVTWKPGSCGRHCQFRFIAVDDDETWLALPTNVNMFIMQGHKEHIYGTFNKRHPKNTTSDNRLLTDTSATCVLRCTQDSDVVLHVDAHTAHALYERSTESEQHRQNILNNKPTAQMKLEDLQCKRGCVLVQAYSPRVHDVHGKVIVVKRCAQKTNQVGKWLLTHSNAIHLKDFVEDHLHSRIDVKYAVDATHDWYNKRALNALADNALHVCAAYATNGTLLGKADAMQCSPTVPFDTSLYVLYKDEYDTYRTWHPNSDAEWSCVDVAQLLLAHALDTPQPTQDELRNMLIDVLKEHPHLETTTTNVDSLPKSQDIAYRQRIVDENYKNKQKHTMLLQSNRAEDMFAISLTAEECVQRAAACEESHSAQDVLHTHIIEQEHDLVDDFLGCITNNRFNAQQLDVVASAHVKINAEWQSFLPSMLICQHEIPEDTPVRLCHKLEPEDIDLKQLHVPLTRHMLVASTELTFNEPTVEDTDNDNLKIKNTELDCFETAAVCLAAQCKCQQTSQIPQISNPASNCTKYSVGNNFADIFCVDQYVALAVHCDSIE